MSALHTLLIDGKRVITEATDPVINPATEEVIAEAPRAGTAEIDRAVTAARRAFPHWAGDEDARRSALEKAADLLVAHAEALGRLITLEQGRPLSGAIGEVHGAAGIVRHYARFRPETTAQLAEGERQVQVVRHPLGVVAAIAPWNVPLLLLIRDIAPALLAGNVVVAKPSEFTPLATLHLGELLAPLFPPGVLNIIAGGKDVGAELTRHPGIAKIVFTGSVAAGKAILHQGADDLKRISLELGGNDAAIVLADAPVESVADRLFDAAFQNSGQICFAVKRVYAHRSLFDALVKALAERASRTRVGNGLDPDVHLGPISNRLQFERLIAIVEDARERGATFHSGGAPLPGPGYFFPPSIVTGVGAGSRIVEEEQFGPVLPILPFDKEEEGIALANATQFGLGGSVWTADPDHGATIAARLDVGLAWVNQHARPYPDAPSGGHKWSGLGHRGGQSGYDHYVALQVLDRVALEA